MVRPTSGRAILPPAAGNVRRLKQQPMVRHRFLIETTVDPAVVSFLRRPSGAFSAHFEMAGRNRKKTVTRRANPRLDNRRRTTGRGWRMSHVRRTHRTRDSRIRESPAHPRTVLSEVHAEHGIATIRGWAATALAKHLCWECCRRVTGVRAVVDLVQLSAG